jgi:hypothetical protein
MVNLHPALSRQGELVFSTNSDTESFWDNFNQPGSADFYRPFFYRVFDWQKVYDDLPLPDAVETLQVPTINAAAVYYNLQGLPVKHPRRGLYIKNGKKVFIK